MADVSKLDPEYDCPVCWNRYNNTFRTPKLLDCRHSFCMECLAHLSIVAQIRNQLQCPLCRHTTVLRPEQLITDLPTNALILRQMKLPPHRPWAKEPRQLNLFTRPPSVYMINVGTESGSFTQQTQVQTPVPAAPGEGLSPPCLRNPQLRMFLYLMTTMLVVSLVLIFSVFWTRRLFLGPG
uniref:Ring finger protein 183 n=1 Tax=Leptobrachium leishanense TaxID=445787 RepID=A0A8C5R6A4_9ANUR